MDLSNLVEADDESGNEPTRRLSLNDLPAEILLKILAEVSDVSRGMRMYIFDFPKPATVCQRWFNIYFEMYYKRWGFLHGREALLSEWKAKALQRNQPERLVRRAQSRWDDSLTAQKLESAAISPPKAVSIVGNQQICKARSVGGAKSTSDVKLVESYKSVDVPDVKERYTALVAAQSALGKETRTDKGWQNPITQSKRKLRKRSQDIGERLLKRTLPLRKLNW